MLAAIVAGALAVVGLWWANNPGGSLHSFADRVTAAGRITGLLGTYLILIQIVLMARVPWLDRSVGTDRLAAWHRSNGQYTVTLLIAHTFLILWGYAGSDRRSPIAETSTLIRSYPDVLAATAGLGLLVLVAITSARMARRRLRYETWYFLHLYTYVAVALSFSHQLATGNEFVAHAPYRAQWIGLYAVTFGSLLVFRVAVPVRDAFRYRLRVAAVHPESGDAVSVYVTGRGLQRMPAESPVLSVAVPGPQLVVGGAPVLVVGRTKSRSAADHGQGVGDHSQALRHVRAGTRVMAEGSYGNLTARRRTRRRVLLIAGGVGITPLRAMIEDLPAGPGDITLLYRASSEKDLLFRAELEPDALTVVVEGRDLAVATSGIAERGRHVIDPITGRPAEALASVTVVGPELVLTDAYATAALAMGRRAPSWLGGLAAHEAYVIDTGGHVWWTAGFSRHAPALAGRPVPILTAGS